MCCIDQNQSADALLWPEQRASILLKLHSHQSKFPITPDVTSHKISPENKSNQHLLLRKQLLSSYDSLCNTSRANCIMPPILHCYNCLPVVLIDFWLPNLGLGLDLRCFDSCIPVLYDTTHNLATNTQLQALIQLFVRIKEFVLLKIYVLFHLNVNVQLFLSKHLSLYT